MANYTTTITNEGAALLASVIANQGTLTFNEFRFSENDYTGQESTLTEGTFLGVFITASAAASVIDSTTIKASAQFNNSTITGNHDLYSIGIVGTDGNTTALIAVCTTTDPDVIREPLTGTSTYAFNVNLSVSDTSQINVFGTTAAVLYDVDVVDTLISTATDKPLSANQGRLVADNLAANENVYGAKNKLDITANLDTINGITFTVNPDKTITATGTASADAEFKLAQLQSIYIESDTDYILSGCPTGGAADRWFIEYTNYYDFAYKDTGDEVTINKFNETTYPNQRVNIVVKSGTALPVGGITFKPMLRDARITDPTFVPYAKTNLQLTEDSAERADLATLNLTGSTNSTGSTINKDTYFYLNGSYCKAKTSIANGATFTLNTNFEVVSVGKELKDALDYSGTYIFNATPAYEGWGGIYLPTPLPIPVKLLSDYTVTISDIKIGRNNGADITIPINANDIYEKTHGGTSITGSLNDYFQSASPEFASFVALRNANAAILIKLDVAHT